MADRLLSRMETLFVASYLQYWDATRAAREAGYAMPEKIGYRLPRRPVIRAAIDAALAEIAMPAPEIVARLSQQAAVNLADFMVFEQTEVLDENSKPVIDPVTGKVKTRTIYVDVNWEMVRDRGYLLKGLEYSRQGKPVLKLADSQKALELLGRHRKLFDGEIGNASSDVAFSLPADVISPSFISAYRDIRAHKHTEYVFYGGRGSTKSSFISLTSIYLLLNNPSMYMLAARQVAETLRDSVYNQLLWAIGELGLSDKFKCTVSPMEITYLLTGQKIYFRGADDPGKIKSIKPPQGYIGILWFEELDQFHGEEAIRKIEQSVIRGGDLAFIFKSFNPPRTANNWANKYVKVPKATQYQHKSDYLGVPEEWLGKAFLEEAAHLKEVNPSAYEHEYLGIANSAGGLIFENVTLRKITDEEIAQFDRVLHGQDWGYYPDPNHYSRSHYDAARRVLYIFGEYRAWKQSNRALYDALVKYGLKSDDTLIADSAEPKSVADFREYGASCRGAEKGPDSVKYSVKWLQGLTAIIIDNERCPFTAEEFISYEYEQDPDGNYISDYPDKNNHAIDSVRYGTNLIWRKRGQ